MVEPTPDRRAELIAAALAKDLSADEHTEFEAMMRSDPSIAVELDELGATLRGLHEAGAGWPSDRPWLETDPPAGLRGRVLDADAASSGAEADHDPTEAEPERAEPARSRWSRLYIAAACFVLGVAVTAGAYAVSAMPPSGPPGTLGAVEEVEFAGVADGVEIDGALIAHTWGTESVLEIEGLVVGESYAVVLLAGDGVEFDSGSFIGSEVRIDCRMNAAVMRHEVTRLEIRDDGGALVTGVDLPEAVES